MKKILQILTIILIVSGCVNTNRKIEGFLINEGRYKFCIEKMANPNFFYYQDTLENFKIMLHREWWLEKSEIKNSYGITAIDSTLNQNETRLIAVTVLSEVNENLFEYVSSEIRNMKNDSSMQILKVGKHRIDLFESYWIKYRANEKLETNGILNYFKDDETGRMFIIHSLAFGDKNNDKVLCHLQNLVMTFRMNDE